MSRNVSVNPTPFSSQCPFIFLLSGLARIYSHSLSSLTAYSHSVLLSVLIQGCKNRQISNRDAMTYAVLRPFHTVASPHNATRLVAVFPIILSCNPRGIVRDLSPTRPQGCNGYVMGLPPTFQTPRGCYVEVAENLDHLDMSRWCVVSVTSREMSRSVVVMWIENDTTRRGNKPVTSP